MNWCVINMTFWLMVVLVLLEDGASEEVSRPRPVGLDNSGVNQVNEICSTETMEARCRWNSEVIVMTSARWGRMKTGRCLNIDLKRLASNRDDPMFIGCSEDVLSLLDIKCSSKPACDVAVPNPDLERITPCYDDLTRYLAASYTCVNVVQESRSCVVSVTTEAQFISSSSSTSSDSVNSVSNCGSKSHPWRLEAAAGQRINISLLDFTATSSMSAMAAGEKRPRDRMTCRQYGYVLEKLNKRNVSVCGGGGAELRQSHIVISDSNNVEVVLAEVMSTNQHFQRNFLIGIEAVGCTNMVPPDNAWLRRSHNDIIIGCYSSQQTWQLNCDGREWKGLVGTCPELYNGNARSLETPPAENSLEVMVVMFIIAIAAVMVCVAVVCIGCFCLSRYKQDAIGKMKMSNGCATDLYLSHSRCVRNKEKAVDNNIFTGHLPCTGSQRHHWQQQQQQLLMQQQQQLIETGDKNDSAFIYNSLAAQ